MAKKTDQQYQQELADSQANRDQQNQGVLATSSALSAINPAFGFIGAGYVGASNWLHGGDAERKQALLNQRAQGGDYGVQQLRNNYYDTANGLGGQIYGGGFGNYGSFNPYQTGQSPFMNYGMPQQQISPAGQMAQQVSPDKLVRSYDMPQQQGLSSQQGQALLDGWYSSRLDGPNALNTPTKGSMFSPNANPFYQNTPENQARQEFRGLDKVPMPGDGQDYSQILQILGQGQQGGGQMSPQQWGGGGGQPQQGLLDRFNQASQVSYDPRIDQLVGQQGQGIQDNQPLNMQNLRQLQQQLGFINQGSQQGLQELIGQSQGNNQNIQSLFNQQAWQQGQNNPQAQAYENLLGLGQSFAQGQQNTQNFDQFTGAVSGAIGNNQQNINGIDQQTQALIDANNASSQFEQDKAIQDLNDQLSARGLSNSQAGTEAISGAMSQFARQRANDQAKIRQEALNTSFNQRLQGNNLQGSLAGQGAGILSQQGQTGNNDLNSRLRALDTSGGLIQGQGNQQSQGIGNLLQLLNANQQGIGNINSLQNQANQQNAGFAQANYGLNQQGINMGNDTLSQLMALYQGNEQRNQQIGQQGFQNAGAVYNAGNNLITNGMAGANQQFMQNQQINATQGLQNQQIKQANQAGYGQLAGAGLGMLNEFYQGYRQNNPQVNNPYPQNNGGNTPGVTSTTRDLQYNQY